MLRLLLIIVFAALWAGPGQAQDIEGSADHPLAGRFKGSAIVAFKAKDFDELVFLTAPVDYGALLERNATDDRSGAEWLTLQGRATEIRYQVPAGRSSLEVLSNYGIALKAKGFTTVFTCTDKSCLTGNLRDLYLLGELLDPGNGVSTAYSEHGRYLLAKLDRPEGHVYVSVLAGEANGETVAFLRVLEAAGMQTDNITVIKAAEIAADLEQSGSIDIYGIEFDFDQDTVKPESKPALDEIAKVLTGKPELKLKLVGHTDNKGKPDYNLDLSQRRAANVAAALVSGYGIDASRLTSEGAGMSRPVAPNDTDDGRAKNRRVELVAQ